MNQLVFSKPYLVSTYAPPPPLESILKTVLCTANEDKENKEAWSAQKTTVTC